MKSVRAIVFGLSLFVSLFASVSQAQMMSSSYSCAATTPCFDVYNNYLGNISCQVYGHQYVSGYGVASNSSCSWQANYNHSVQCTGFQQVRNAYGQFVWGWQNFYYTCR